MTNSANVIEFNNVEFTYTDEQSSVLHYLNCSFYKNKLNLLLGPSGCGKSTALYMLNGIIPYAITGTYEGEVLLNGENILGKNPQDLSCKVGFVFQDPESQFCTFTVEDEIAFGLENINVPQHHIADKITKALVMVGMMGSEKLILSKLSGGQKQKIAIAAVLAMEPEIIVLDEPTANLDPVSTYEIFALLENLVHEYAKTVIVVEHKLDGFMQRVDHIVMMDENGEMKLTGTPNRVLTKLLYDEEYDNIRVFLPEHLLIIKDIFSKLGHLEPIRKLRQAELANALAHINDEYSYGLDYGVEILLKISDVLHLDKFSEQKNSVSLQEPLLEIKNLGFSYELPKKKTMFSRPLAEPFTKSILEDVSLTIHQGDFAAILGPNGVGKSTLLNLIFQVSSNYRGQITLHGKDVSHFNKQKLYQSLGLVFQNPEWQFVTNDVEAELFFSLKASDLSDKEKAEKIDEVLKQFHLENDREKSPFLLSQGQKRRLSVAAMLLTGQKILFLDEPTYGQDYENQLELMELMRKLNQDGITIVLISHDMSLVADYVDTVHLLVDGVVQFSGRPAELFDNNEMIEKGRLQKPVTLVLSERLQKQLPDFPLLISKEKMVQLFCAGQVTWQRGQADVCL